MITIFTSFWFWYAFLWWLAMFSILCACCPSVCLLWKSIYFSLLPIFKIKVFFFIYIYFVWAVYKLWILTPYLSYCLQMFSHSVGYLFILLMVKVIIRSHLFSFCFYFFCLRRHIQKKYCCNLCQSVLLVFSSRSFIASDLAFKSLNSFCVYFCIWYEEIVLMAFFYKSSFPSTTHWRDCFLHCVFLLPLLRLIDCNCVGSLFSSIDQSVFVPELFWWL